jgi:ATP-dependent DNA helicase RecG
MKEDEILQRLDIGEDQDTEFKAANGGLPNSMWETVSAFANTEGGYIILGVAHHSNRLELIGLKNPENLLKTFWDVHNNSRKLSVVLCTESDVQIVTVSGYKLIVIHIPRAQRTQCPVFINGNPLTGAYKRNFEGDYRCSAEEVRQMLRDASDTPQDSTILHKFDLHDLDKQALKDFRQRFASRTPDHPFLAFDDQELLSRLGGWRHDRKTDEKGLTLAGLLMFGRERSILDALPYFHLDYQEHLSDDPEVRWTYRLTLDGTWEPNLFNFYYRVYPRLVDDLEVPFKLNKDAVRLDETHVHEALREALINSLVHADYQYKRAVTIIKQADRFSFKNPGRLRISKDRLFEGGISDPRNPHLQKIFQLIGLGEKAGSGFQKILRAWREQSWAIPLVAEDLELELTSIMLPMISLIPEAVTRELKEIVGNDFSSLSEIDRIVLVLAHHLGKINNSDVKRYRSEHPREIGEHLKYLVTRGWLKQSGHGRGTQYSLLKDSSQHYEGSSQHYEGSSQHYEGSSQHYEGSSQHYDRLKEISVLARTKKRLANTEVRRIILDLCREDYLSVQELAGYLQRNSISLGNHYLIPMVKEGLLIFRHPEQPRHPQQGYKTRE